MSEDVFGFPWESYAERIGLTARPTLDVEGLHALHVAQFLSVPFENLDIQLGREIDLAPASLLRKLVDRQRGGYCFELNGLMLLALRHLGFAARPLLARVHLAAPPSGRTHQLNAVALDGRIWLMDVGFGAGGPCRPMLLEEGWEVTGAHWGYRLERSEPWGWLMSSMVDDTWRASYSFDLGHVTPQDIAVSNFYTSHSPDTHFTRRRIVSRPTVEGRVSLSNQVRTRVVGAVSTVDEIAPGEPTIRVLAEEFGIVLDVGFESFLPVQDD
jgi:N-hydroxyarylamine O-acetyltransferase